MCRHPEYTDVVTATRPEIKSFISSLLSRHDKERMEEVVEMVEEANRKISWANAIKVKGAVITNAHNGGYTQDEHQRKVGVVIDNEFEKLLATLRSPEGGECDYCEGMGQRTVSVETDSGVGEIQREECEKCKGIGTPHSSGGGTR